MKFKIYQRRANATRTFRDDDPLAKGAPRCRSIVLGPDSLDDLEVLHDFAALGDMDVRVTAKMHEKLHDVVVSYQIDIVGPTNS